MSDNLPQPLPGAPALRAHLKALERGVAEARSHRLGVDPVPSRAVSQVGVTANGNGASHGISGGIAARRPTPSPYTLLKPNPTAASANSSADGKPRAARAKSTNGFGEFFDSIDKRATG